MQVDYPYRQDISACHASIIGHEGIDPARWENFSQRAAGVLLSLQEQLRDEEGGPLQVPLWQHDLGEITSLADRIRRQADTLVVIGTGGSSLGGRMLESFHAPGGRTRCVFMENVDPHSVSQMLEGDLSRHFFLVISKSGGTVETIGQALAVIAALSERVSRHAPAAQMAVVTMPQDSPLKAIAEQHHMPVIDHPIDVGGRFSVLTAVGLIPAAVCGVDISALRRGAANILSQWMRAETPEEAPPLAGAMVACGLMEQGTRIAVLMPYADRLFHLGSWYRQLWAESLGKQGHGSVPIRALGTIDQHSQLQLYLDGPADKYYTIITTQHAGKGSVIDLGYAQHDARLSYLEGHRIGDVMEAEQQATIDTLKAAGRPVRLLHMPVLDSEALGAMLMHFMLETVAAAKLLGINAYDQPAVEDGKRRARQMLAASRENEPA